MTKNKTSTDSTISQILAIVQLLLIASKIYSIACNLLIRVFLLISNYCNDERQTVLKLSNFLLSEDVQAILEILITQESKITRSPLRKKMRIFYLFFDILWGNRIIPYFENKFLPNTKEID